MPDISVKFDGTRKPALLPIFAENIPGEMRNQSRWLGWRWEWNPGANRGQGKWTKPPVDILRDRLGSSTNSATWCDFTTALRAAESGFVDGVGFALGDGYCGVDFDNCRDRETGVIAPDVQAYVHRLHTYGEVSPSGEGVKLILRGTLPPGRRANGNVEAYDRGRYFTLTGHRLEIASAELNLNDDELAALHRELIEQEQEANEQRRETRLADRELALAALAGLSAERADGYHDWLLVGMALHATDPQLLDSWDEWSRQSTHYSSGCCAEKWQSFDGSAVGLGSLIHWAREDGWTPSRRQSDRNSQSRWQQDADRADGNTNDSTFVPRPLTDLGNAERFVAQHQRHARFVATWEKWLVWDGTRWRQDTTRKVWRHAKQTVRSIYREAARLAQRPEVEVRELNEISGWAKVSEKRDRMSAMLALAANEEDIAIDHSVLDADPWLLNCRNGTVNLRTGELLPHDPNHLITKTTGVEFLGGTDIGTPVWTQFLESTFCGDQDLIGFLQRLIGYAAVGVIREHVLAILWGGGSNGKSTLLNAILDVLGDYGYQAPQGFLTARRSESHPTELTDLFGMRFVSIAETDDGQRLDEGMVKMLTGGEQIRARRMREDFWEFGPTHTPFLATNYKPIVRGGDYGIWRRLKLIPFNATFVDPTESAQHPGAPFKDPELPEKLKAERSGILQWIVTGCLEWQRVGLAPPEAVLAATRTYKSESDTFAGWIADQCEAREHAEIRASVAYKQYREWCEDAGEKPVTINKFAEKVEEAGFGRARRRNGVFYQGFSIRAGY